MPGRSRLSTTFGEEDGARAGAPDGAAAGAEVAQGLLEAVAEDEPGDGRALAAGDDERVDLVELGDLADLADGMAHGFEHLAVLAEVALEGEHANGLALESGG